jgi:hypothetical protein
MMNLALENYGVVEMNQEEKEQEQGGIIWPLVAIAAAFVISAMNNWGDIREGWADGATGTPRH